MAGRVFDVTGSYEYAFSTLALMAAGALVLMASLPAPRSERLLRASTERRPARSPVAAQTDGAPGG